MIIVLDTNVLVSGLLSPYGSPGRIVRMVVSGELSLRHDSRILSEYREVLLRSKFSFGHQDVEALLDVISANGETVFSRPLQVRLADPDDEIFLEAAMSDPATSIVTGNARHFPPQKTKQVRIFSPFEFLRHYYRL